MGIFANNGIARRYADFLDIPIRAQANSTGWLSPYPAAARPTTSLQIAAALQRGHDCQITLRWSPADLFNNRTAVPTVLLLTRGGVADAVGRLADAFKSEDECKTVALGASKCAIGAFGNVD